MKNTVVNTGGKYYIHKHAAFSRHDVHAKFSLTKFSCGVICDMVVEYIRYKIDPANSRAFIRAYKNAVEQLKACEFCLGYELTECEEEAGHYILRIEWTSTLEHLDGFRKSALFPQFYHHVKPYFDSIQEMRHYKLTEVVESK